LIDAAGIVSIFASVTLIAFVVLFYWWTPIARRSLRGSFWPDPASNRPRSIKAAIIRAILSNVVIGRSWVLYEW